MASKFIRCPHCYWRLAVAEDADIAFDLDMHRLSGHCRAYEPPKAPKERTPRQNALNRLDDWMGDY